MAGDETNLAAGLCQIVDGLADGFGNRTHSHDDVLCVFCTVVGEGTVLAACELADLAHVASNDVRNSLVVLNSLQEKRNM